MFKNALIFRHSLLLHQTAKFTHFIAVAYPLTIPIL